MNVNCTMLSRLLDSRKYIQIWDQPMRNDIDYILLQSINVPKNVEHLGHGHYNHTHDAILWFVYTGVLNNSCYTRAYIADQDTCISLNKRLMQINICLICTPGITCSEWTINTSPRTNVGATSNVGARRGHRLVRYAKVLKSCRLIPNAYAHTTIMFLNASLKLTPSS